MLLKFEDLDEGRIYYAQALGWGKGESNGALYYGKYLSEEQKKLLDDSSSNSDQALLKLFTIPLLCKIKNGTKTLETQSHVQQAIIGFFEPINENIDSDTFSLQDHKDIISGYISSLEALFEIQETDELQDTITSQLDVLYDDISIILDNFTENDDIDDTIEKINARLRIFLLEINQDTHATITLETDGSLYQVLIEARNYLDKKFGCNEDNVIDEVDNERIYLENKIERENAIQYLRTMVFSFNTLFAKEEGYRPDQIDDRVLQLFDQILSLISSISQYPQSQQKRQSLHLQLVSLLDKFWTRIFENMSLTISSQRTIISYCDNMTVIEEAVFTVLKLKDYSLPKLIESPIISNISSAKYLYDTLLACQKIINDHRTVGNASEEVIAAEQNIIDTLSTLAQCSEEAIGDLLSKKELEQLLDIVLRKEDYIFAVKIRDIITSKK